MLQKTLLSLPSDVTKIEQKLVTSGYAFIYSLFTDPIDKFIIAFRFDLNHTKSITAQALGVTPKTIWAREKMIKSKMENLKPEIRSRLAE